ncbi:MAG: DUF1302 family protein [Gammaproteobacteria bacterium]
MRLYDNPQQPARSLAETRLQLDLAGETAVIDWNLTADFIYDDLADTHGPALDRGRGAVDLREAYVGFAPLEFLDVKLGRQILTWGTADFVFINDLFPKDWNAFLLGRDDDYLKAPADAVRLSFYASLVNVDIAYTPRFAADRYINGRRLSYFNPVMGRVAGQDAILRVDRPGAAFADDEWALRLHRLLHGFELALYAYNGFWKSPAGFTPADGRATFPRLRSIGGSLRGPLGPGIVHAETGYYASRDDGAGRNPLVANSEVRFVIGYELEAARNLTVGLQYYLEALRHHGAYRRALAPGQPARDAQRHLLTTRITWRTHRQNLIWSLFAFVSPSDSDAYLRPELSYQLDDRWRLEGGLNVFLGTRRHTFFGQFEDDSNAYLAVRYAF